MSDRLRISEKGDLVDSPNRGLGENLNNLVGDDRSETVVVVRRTDEEKENVGFSRETRDLNGKWGELGSSKSALNEGKLQDSEDEQPSCVIVDVKYGGGIGENFDNLVDDEGSETVNVIRSDDSKVLNAKRDELESSKSVAVTEEKFKESEDEQHSCVIDVKCFGENLEGEKVCRICHLSSERSEGKYYSTTSTTTADLIQLGCDCKDELGIAHSHCAEAWFKLRGNRQCEICGETAKHIKGVGDNRFMEEWNDRRSGSDATLSSDGGGGYWRGQPFCNFLMACLVIAFVLPWFFRVNMF